MIISNKDFQGHVLFSSVFKCVIPAAVIALGWQLWVSVLGVDVVQKAEKATFLYPLLFKIALLTAVFVAVGYWLNIKGPGNLFKKNAQLEKKIGEALGRYDYYNIGLSGGIAVDVKNNKLAIIDASECYPKIEQATESIIEIDKILSMNAFSPGREHVSNIEVHGTGMDGATGAALANTLGELQASSKNERINFNAAVSTGLIVKVDDLHQPKAFSGMPFVEAEAWQLLLSKIRNGDVESLSQPERFPRKQVSFSNYLK